MTDLIDALPQPHRNAVRVFGVLSRHWRVALVGGAVRDVFAERCPSDLDFVVQGCPSDETLAEAAPATFGRSARTGFGGCRTQIGEVWVDAWRVESNALRPCATIEVLVGADGGSGGFTFDADCGVVDLAAPDALIDGGLAEVMRTGVFELRRARGLKFPPPAIVLTRAAAIVDRYGWAVGPVLTDYVKRHADDASLQRAETFAAQTGRAYLTAARIRELLRGARLEGVE